MNFVKKIIDNWNPIDLFPGAPDDEYWTEIEAIEHIVRDTDNPVKLAEGIYSVFIKEFDDTFKKSKEECEQIAQTILLEKKSFNPHLNWWNRQNRNDT